MIFQPGDIGGVRRHNCIGKGIGVCTSACFNGPTHLFQIVDSQGQRKRGMVSADETLWCESTVGTRVPCLFAKQIVKGVQVHHVHSRLDEEELYGSTVWRYRFKKDWTDKELKKLWDSWYWDLCKPYDWWGSFDARLLGGGLLLRAGLRRFLPSRRFNGKWFCSEKVANGLRTVGRWDGDPSQWAPYPFVWSLGDLITATKVMDHGKRIED